MDSRHRNIDVSELGHVDEGTQRPGSPKNPTPTDPRAAVLHRTFRKSQQIEEQIGDTEKFHPFEDPD